MNGIIWMVDKYKFIFYNFDIIIIEQIKYAFFHKN